MKGALNHRVNFIRAAVHSSGAGIAEAMRTAGAESLFQVMRTALVALHLLVEEAAVRKGCSARNIRNIFVALYAASEGETDRIEANDTD